MTAERDAPHDSPASTLEESVLELRDQVIGLQAQLDELHARIDRIEERTGARLGLARVRSRVQRLRRPAARPGDSSPST